MKKYKWYKIAENLAEGGLGEKEIVSLSVGGKTICLARYQNSLYGCAPKWPHEPGPDR